MMIEKHIGRMHERHRHAVRKALVHSHALMSTYHP